MVLAGCLDCADLLMVFGFVLMCVLSFGWCAVINSVGICVSIDVV